MFYRIVGAGLRAVLASLLVALPALAMPETVGASGYALPLVCSIAAVFVFIEYYTDYPSVVEFRDAPPFNRLRFACLFAVVLTTALLCTDLIRPTLLSSAIASLGGLVGAALDVPYSPVRLMLIGISDSGGARMLETVRAAAGLACIYAAVTLASFLVIVRRGWPVRTGAFNVWINMPLFDPTAGGDIVLRLRREARINLMLGALLPFVLPAVFKLVALVIGPLRLADPHTLIWVMSVWAFLPVSLIMRAIALGRVADMVEHKRRRQAAAAQAEALAPA
ncbi:MAG: hypothetical protein ACLFTP_05805 [Rhodosalinus sp.]|uniref:hypothetical protein n=1 Tax=Rhodosalinus sp. TaxID=2047741 RepID=UPI00397E2D04